MPGNLRAKLGNQRERDYLRMRKQLIRESTICKLCFEAVDPRLPAICCKVDTRGYSAWNAHEIPVKCGDGCRHQRKANPWSASIDHIVPVDQLPTGSPLLTSRKNAQVTHLVCNQKKSNGVFRPVDKFVSSGDWF